MHILFSGAHWTSPFLLEVKNMNKDVKEIERVEELPADAYVEPAKKSDDELLELLLGAPEVETKTVYMPRFKQNFKVQSITSDDYSRLENRCKYPVKNKRTHQIEEKVDQDKLSSLLVSKACVWPDWSDKRILERYQTDSPEVAIKKRLLIGEISELSNAILEVSGFRDGLEEAKNSYEEAAKQE